LKWFKSFQGIGVPVNALTQKNYKGINFWSLCINREENKYTNMQYATKKAWQSVGATIKTAKAKMAQPFFIMACLKSLLKIIKMRIWIKIFIFKN
jgi:hypothetical protein